VVTAAGLAASLLLAPDMALLPRLGLALGIGLVPASIQPLFGRSLRRTPLATWGMVVAHLGVAVALVGMASDSAFTKERLAVVREGQSTEVGPWLVELAQVLPVAGPNWTALEAELRASRGRGVTVLRPQSRYFAEPPTATNEAAIDTVWNGQLYAVLGERDPSGGWQLRLWWKPFVTLIWLGGALIALGGLLALVGRGLRARRQRRHGEEQEV
jgi:cytochrome c-type biogenesis protein CcmF